MSDQFDDPDAAGSGDNLDGAGGKGLNAKKIALFVILPLLLIAGVGGGAYFSGMLGPKDAIEGAAPVADKKGGKNQVAETSAPVFLEIPNMLVNLSDPGGQQRYLRLKVQLELTNSMDMEAVQAVMPRVVDQFQTYLRELRVRDLRGSAGIYRLQMELLSRVNAAAYPVEVKDVLFQEILIQ